MVLRRETRVLCPDDLVDGFQQLRFVEWFYYAGIVSDRPNPFRRACFWMSGYEEAGNPDALAKQMVSKLEAAHA